MQFTIDPSRLKANMDAIRRRMGDNAQRRAVRAGARVIGEAMVERTPVLDGKTTGSDALDPGTMQASMRVRTRTGDMGPYALVGPAGEGVPKIAHNVEYGHRLVKGGTSRMDIAGKLKGAGVVIGDVPSHPFLRPAYEASASDAVAAMAASYSEDFKGDTNG